MVLLVPILAACADPPKTKHFEIDLVDTTRGDTVPPVEPPCVPAARLVVNELSSSNVDAIIDRDGHSPDWIELYNAGTDTIALGGWSLSDDPDDPRKWSLPALTLTPGAYQLVFASEEPDRTAGSFDTRVDQGHTWRYLEALAPPAAGWSLPEFDDSAWPSGPSGFGYADGDDETLVATPTVYLRTDVELTLEDLADLATLDLHVDYDDGFVAYLNGVEVARAGLTGTPPSWDEFAVSSVEAQVYQGGAPGIFDLRAAIGLLSEGANTLAVEVHDSAGSSDLSIVPFLTLGLRSERGGTTSAALALPRNELHASFALRSEGERLTLTDPEGCAADVVDAGQLYGDQSYGRQPDGSDEGGYFLVPTPGSSNVTESRPGFAITPKFDPPGGYTPGGATVTVVAGPNAEIRTATEGFEPTETDPVYTDPLPTGTTGEAAVLRARAWEDGLWPSRIATATYLFTEPGALPIVSLVTDPPNLWDDEIGIYTYGTNYEPEPPYTGANFLQDWQRPVHMQEWEPDGTSGFAVDAGVEIHGGYSRRNEQKSLLVKLGDGYGETSFEHDLFPGLGVDEFTRVLLRDSGNDWHGCKPTGCSHGSHLRDPIMQTIAGVEDIDTMAYRPTEVYLNGVYWGIYHLNERPDAAYVRDHYGEEDIDLLTENAEALKGDNLHYLATLELLRTADPNDPATWAEVQARIDVDSYAAYVAYELFYDNTDWPNHNIKFWRPRTPDGRWRWLLYDTDFGIGSWDGPVEQDSFARIMDLAGPNEEWSTELFRLLVRIPAFESAFVNRYADAMNTALVPASTLDTFHALVGEIEPYMPRHVDRWGTWTDGVTSTVMPPGEWEEQLAEMDVWLAARPEHARQHVVTNLGLAGTWTLQLEADPPGAGTFALPTVTVEAPFSGVYFQGVPVSVTAVPAPGRSFVGWSDPSLPADATLTLDPGAPLTLVARFE